MQQMLWSTDLPFAYKFELADSRSKRQQGVVLQSWLCGWSFTRCHQNVKVTLYNFTLIVLNYRMFLCMFGHDFKECIWKCLRNSVNLFEDFATFSLFPYPFFPSFIYHSLYCLHLQIISNKAKENLSAVKLLITRAFMSLPTTGGKEVPKREIPERCEQKTNREVDDLYPPGPVCYSTVSLDQE